jgi:hypothetical protein
MPGKHLAEAFIQGEQKHILNRLVLELVGIKLASSLGLSDMGPVGCTVAGSTESVLFHESFHQNRPIGIKLLPI